MGGWAIGPDPLVLSVYKELLSVWWGWLSCAPSSGQSSQGFTGGAHRGIVVHLVSRVERLSPNTCQGTTACSVKQAGAQA